MADPIFNLKTGADSEIYFAREVTQAGAKFGLLKTKEGVYNYPVLTRTTGNSIKGTTESIESNELRKGRKKSAPRKGNSSSEGNIEVEYSPVTYDDMLEAAFRNTWKRWISDSDSESNIDKNEFEKGHFYTKCLATPNGTFGSRKLLDTDGSGVGLIRVPEGSVVHELNCGTTDIKYMLLRHFGGVTGEDLYQKFVHQSINTISMDVQVGAIVTGSIGFSGTNDPLMNDKAQTKLDFGGDTSESFDDNTMTGTAFVDNLPDKATSTDQFTAREGFLFVNGEQIEFANSLDFELNNGIEKKYAIFVKNAIAATPLSLDITGTLKTYLIKDGSDELFNNAVKDTDNELLFCIQDKTDNPEYLYVFQIFSTKFTDHDASVSGKDTLEVSFPYQSFGERAIRLFRIALPSAMEATLTKTDAGYTGLRIKSNVEVSALDIDSLSVEATIGDTDITMGTASVDEVETSPTYKDVLYAFATPIETTSSEQVLNVKITWNGNILSKQFIIPVTA